jgi:hypothetical protein
MINYKMLHTEINDPKKEGLVSNGHPTGIQFAVTQTRKFFRLKHPSGLITFVTLWELNNKFALSNPPVGESIYTNEYLLPKAQYRLPKPEGLHSDIIDFLRDNVCVVLGK